ncbi:MAG: hypothetical protein E6I26_13260 [Chloroflexi bacterium]|nr:MAG: hypothetical protein E6I26_13260 [Chloroflexota bacterium]
MAWVVLNVAYLLVVARLMHRRLLIGELKAWYLTDLAPPLLAAVAVASALRFLIPAGATAASLLALALALSGILAASALAASHVREGVLGMARVWARRP